MTIKQIIFTSLLVLFSRTIVVANTTNTDSQQLILRDSMTHAFNNGDSARFAIAIKNYEDYFLKRNDLHGYYTQRCNEIVFQLNNHKILEAYKLGLILSDELRTRKLDKEMYMAYNIMGHIYRFCGNEKAALKCFMQVIEMLDKSGYRESLPPIYMNIVNVVIEDRPAVAMEMIETALEIAKKESPERVFDIETRRSLCYYNMGRKEDFLNGYKAYKKGVAEGKSSVHGRTMEIYYQACLGHTDEAIRMAFESMNDDAYTTVSALYRDAGRWKEAYEAQEKSTQQRDSINSLILSNSIQGMHDELQLYNLERENTYHRTITMTIIIGLLLLFVLSLGYIVYSRRHHISQLSKAYQHALESDKIKTVFIQNISHEVRTPLNIIAGFAQVIADPQISPDASERKEISKMVLKNTRLITNLIDEMLELSINESAADIERCEGVDINSLLEKLVDSCREFAHEGVELILDNHLAPGFTMTTNETKVRRLIYCLIDNALKFTDEGHITVKATSDNCSLVVVVEDTGCGIPPEEQSRIFERFVKLHDFKEGLGLGLPLCRMIASKLRGSIILDSSYTKGARFVVSLPL